MQNESPHLGPAMPAWARIIAAVFGAALLALGLFMLVTMRSLRWEMLVLAITAVGLATDFLHGAARGRWPVLIHFWVGV